MKKLSIIIGTLIVALTLAACGNNDSGSDNNGVDNTANTEQNNANNDQTRTDDNSNNDSNTAADDSASDPDADDNSSEKTSDNDNSDMQQKMDELDYRDFELEVSYDNNKEYEVEIELDNEQVSADLEDELNGEDLKGKEAFDKIYPNVKKLTIDQSTNKDDAIKQILDAFDLEDDYKKFETEITFKDNTKIEFEDEK